MVWYHSCSRRCPRGDHRGDGLGVGHRRRHVTCRVASSYKCVARGVTVVRRSDAANSHQPPLPSLDLQLIAHDVLRNAARDPTPRLLGVRMAVKEDAHIRGFEFSERIPTRLFGTLERGEQGRPVPLPLAEIIHDPGNAQPLRPGRAGVRRPETIRAEGGRPASHPAPVHGRQAAQTGCLPIAEHTRRPDPIQHIQRRHVADVTQGQNMRRAACFGVSQNTLQPVAPAVNVGKDCPDLRHSRASPQLNRSASVTQANMTRGVLQAESPAEVPLRRWQEVRKSAEVF